jgi:hypothetical protein
MIPVAVSVPAMALAATDRRGCWRCWLCCCTLLAELPGLAGPACCLQPECSGLIDRALHLNLLCLRQGGPLRLCCILLLLVVRPFACSPACAVPRRLCIQLRRNKTLQLKARELPSDSVWSVGRANCLVQPNVECTQFTSTCDSRETCGTRYSCLSALTGVSPICRCPALHVLYVG